MGKYFPVQIHGKNVKVFVDELSFRVVEGGKGLFWTF